MRAPIMCGFDKSAYLHWVQYVPTFLYAKLAKRLRLLLLFVFGDTMVSLFQQHNVYFVFHFVALPLAASCLSTSNNSNMQSGCASWIQNRKHWIFVGSRNKTFFFLSVDIEKFNWHFQCAQIEFYSFVFLCDNAARISSSPTQMEIHSKSREFMEQQCPKDASFVKAMAWSNVPQMKNKKLIVEWCTWAQVCTDAIRKINLTIPLDWNTFITMLFYLSSMRISWISFGFQLRIKYPFRVQWTFSN